MKFSASGWFGRDWYGNVEEAARYGFQGIEQLGWRHLDLPRAAETLKKYNIVNSAVIIESTDDSTNAQLAWTHGMVYEDARKAFIDAFTETAGVCQKLGVPNIIATTGNERTDIPREQQFEICVGTLQELSRIAGECGLTIVLEPLNILVDHKGYLLSRSCEAFDMLRAVDSPSCRLLFDIYHQQITEGNLIRNITENIDLIGHFHIADNPGRKQPGTGEIHYAKVFEAIEQTGYSGWLAFECGSTLPVPELCEQMNALIRPFDGHK